MRGHLGVVVVFSLTSLTAQAAGLSDCGLHKTNCRDLIGKRLWVVVPKSNPNTVEVSPTPNDYKNTLEMRAGSFLVKDVIPNTTIGHYFVVTLPDGKTGYVWNSSWFFSPKPIQLKTRASKPLRKRIVEKNASGEASLRLE